MSGGFEVEFGVGKNRVDTFFPKATRFRMSLKCMLNGKDMFGIDGFTKFLFLPVNKWAIKGNVGGCFWRR